MQPPKLLWLSRHIPKTFNNAQFFDLTDFLTFKATGATDRSTCTLVCKWLYQGRERRWPECDLPCDRAWGPARCRRGSYRNPRRRAGSAAGTRPNCFSRRRNGTSGRLPVAAGLIDAHAGALGTIGGALAAESCRSASPARPDSRHIVVLHGPERRSSLRSRSLGAAVRWSCARSMADRRRSKRFWRRDRSDVYACTPHTMVDPSRTLEHDILARCGAPSDAAWLARDLHVLPDFLGNRSPFADPRARGGLIGLDLEEDEASLQALYVAGLCGLAQGLAQVMRALEAGGFAFDVLVASGGAARGGLVRQIVADVCGRRVVTAETEEPVLARFGHARRGCGRPLRLEGRDAGHVSIAGNYRTRGRQRRRAARA